MPQTMYIWKYVDVYDYTNDSSFSLAYILLLSYVLKCAYTVHHYCDVLFQNINILVIAAFQAFIRFPIKL